MSADEHSRVSLLGRFAERSRVGGPAISGFLANDNVPLNWLVSCSKVTMNWIAWLGIAVVVAAIAAVTGIKPRGTKPVAHTRMMAMGRLALLAIVVIFVYLAYRAHLGG